MLCKELNQHIKVFIRNEDDVAYCFINYDTFERKLYYYKDLKTYHVQLIVRDGINRIEIYDFKEDCNKVISMNNIQSRFNICEEKFDLYTNYALICFFKGCNFEDLSYNPFAFSKSEIRNMYPNEIDITRQIIEQICNEVIIPILREYIDSDYGIVALEIIR